MMGQKGEKEKERILGHMARWFSLRREGRGGQSQGGRRGKRRRWGEKYSLFLPFSERRRRSWGKRGGGREGLVLNFHALVLR